MVTSPMPGNRRRSSTAAASSPCSSKARQIASRLASSMENMLAIWADVSASQQFGRVQGELPDRRRAGDRNGVRHRHVMEPAWAFLGAEACVPIPVGRSTFDMRKLPAAGQGGKHCCQPSAPGDRVAPERADLEGDRAAGRADRQRGVRHLPAVRARRYGRPAQWPARPAARHRAVSHAGVGARHPECGPHRHA